MGSPAHNADRTAMGIGNVTAQKLGAMLYVVGSKVVAQFLGLGHAHDSRALHMPRCCATNKIMRVQGRSSTGETNQAWLPAFTRILEDSKFSAKCRDNKSYSCWTPSRRKGSSCIVREITMVQQAEVI
jgi:hypothetical protein